jgi:D-alanyl-D-alanine carboxypeptidase/D-alanyl-D-alanine-endopeptidase (penicillin-binding protein 4)
LLFLSSITAITLGGNISAGNAQVIVTRPTVTPTPLQTSTPSPTPIGDGKPVQTIEQLQSRIRQRLFSPEVRRGRVGVKITSLNSGKIVFENDSDKYFMPASNMKNFTVAAALEKLTPDFKFVTSVYAPSMPDPSGTVKGDLRIVGRGDITLSAAFTQGETTEDRTNSKPDPNSVYYRGIDRLVDRILAAGVKKIEGDLIGDESYFKGFAIPSTWEWDDLQWYYGAEISALPINDNAIELNVQPGTLGSACNARVVPANPVISIVNRCITSPGSQSRDLRVTKKLDRNILEVTGTVPVGDSGFKGYVTVTHPADLFVAMLKQRLQAKGVTITGNVWTTAAYKNVPSSIPVEIVKLESPPLSIVAAKTMKPSQNMYTETLLWTLGEQFGRSSSANGESSVLGLKVVKDFLKQIGVADDSVVQYDGSGLSRHDLITPSAVVSLYTYMAKQSRYSQIWRDSLTVGGVDGTLGNRFRGTAAAGNIRGTTGTLDQVSALSGYITTAGGEQLVVSVLVNGVADQRTRTGLIDEIVVHLANFNGRID